MTKDQNFTNRELTAMFNVIKDKIDDHNAIINEKLDQHNMIHGEILGEVRTTNGKVASIQKWREQMNGAIKMLGIVVPTIFALLGWMSYEIIHIDDKIRDALSVYEVP